MKPFLKVANRLKYKLIIAKVNRMKTFLKPIAVILVGTALLLGLLTALAIPTGLFLN